MNHPQNKTIDFLFSLVRNVRGAESRGIVARIYFSYLKLHRAVELILDLENILVICSKFGYKICILFNLLCNNY